MTRKRKQRINKKHKQINKKQPKVEKTIDQDDLDLQFIFSVLGDFNDDSDYELMEQFEDSKNKQKQTLQRLVCVRVVDFIEENRERYHLSGNFSINANKDSVNYDNVEFSLKASEKFLCSFSIDPVTFKTKSLKVNNNIVAYQVPVLSAVLNFLCSLPSDGKKFLVDKDGVDHE